jgi:hypothetical protein
MMGIPVSKRVVGLCIAVVSVAAPLPLMARDFALFAGANGTLTDGDKKAQYGYLGLVVPVSMQSLEADGWLGRFWLSYQDYKYDKTSSQRIHVEGPAVEGAVGYQKFFGPDTRLTGYLGLLHRNLDEKPNDSSSNAQQKDNGLKAQVEFTTKFTSSIGLSGIASHVFDIKSTWVRVRPAWYIDKSINVGPEFVYIHGDDYSKNRIGVFVEGIRLGEQANFGLSLGREHNGSNGFVGGDRNAMYGGASMSVRF